jgi:hypothetical protein
VEYDNAQPARTTCCASTTANRPDRISEIDSKFDIHVEGKFERVVMVSANPKGRAIVEDLFPDVEWSTDEKFSKVHSTEWMFAYIRVTRLPPYLEEKVPLAFANSDSLAFAVATTLQRRAEPFRVAHWCDRGLCTYEGTRRLDGEDTALYAEYMPPGFYSFSEQTGRLS